MYLKVCRNKDAYLEGLGHVLGSKKRRKKGAQTSTDSLTWPEPRVGGR